MSTFLYGRIQAKREEAPSGESVKDTPPGLKTYADVLTALVPAEVIAASAFFVSQFTKTTKDANGKDVVTVTDHRNLEIAFYGCAIAAVLIYISGHVKGGTDKGKWDGWDFLRMVIPPLAFAGWSMALTPSTIFDAAFSIGDGTKVLLIVGLAFVLGIAATLLGMKADATAGNAAGN